MNEGFGNKPPAPKPTVEQAPQPKNPEQFLEEIKRPYGLEDIKNFQSVLKEFEERRVREGASYVFSQNSFYEFLTSHRSKPNEEQLDPKKVPVQEYQELELGVFNAWRKNLIQDKDRIIATRPTLTDVIETLEREPVPTNLSELRALYRKYPKMNEMSAVQYQGGVDRDGEMRSGFLHINMARAYGYAYERVDEDMRIYLNPPYEAIPQLSKELINQAAIANIPLYFKTIDFSYQIHSENKDRLDRMLVYTDKAHVEELTHILEDIKSKKPEWFENRELPGLVAPVSEGIGIAAEPNEYQNKKFGNGERTSFNMVRAKFLEAVWTGVMRDVIVMNKEMRPRGGRQFQQIFADHFLASSINRKTMTTENLLKEQEKLRKAWASNLAADSLQGYDASQLQNALMRTLQDLLPYTTPESLIPFVNKRIKECAAEFGVDPDNVALNK